MFSRFGHTLLVWPSQIPCDAQGQVFAGSCPSIVSWELNFKSHILNPTVTLLEAKSGCEHREQSLNARLRGDNDAATVILGLTFKL